MGRQAAGLLPELAEHVANESGWLVVSGTLSGVGGSTGTFSASKWREDLSHILDRVAKGDRRVSLAGFGFGGSLALAVAASDERGDVGGVDAARHEDGTSTAGLARNGVAHPGTGAPNLGGRRDDRTGAEVRRVFTQRLVELFARVRRESDNCC